MKRRPPRWTLALALLFALDRLLKYAAVVRFFRRPPPPPPADWPSLSVLQPVTRGASGLAGNLRARLGHGYPGAVEHFLICDRADDESRRICEAALAAHPAARATILLADAPGGVAGKIEKLDLALPLARGEMLWFLDDDVAPRPGAAATLVRHLGAPGAGSAFGLACYVNWRTVWSSAMSSFVNANVLISYLPLAALTEPYTITGHCFMLRRQVFEAIGGLAGMAGRVDDDHELARRVQAAGLRNLQTPLVYDVDNELGSWAAYANQMRRWAVFPRATMLPQMRAYDRAVTALGSLANLLPGLVALGAL
ncbi:MAG TPA: glycosyltransferase, partial [Herpetosiphonaceae bacterium]